MDIATEQGTIITPTAAISWIKTGRAENDQTGQWLSPAETIVSESLKTPKRHQDWLLGRWAAKQLIRSDVFQRTGRILPLQAIEIISHPDGWPQVEILSRQDDPGAGYTLSISHSHDLAFCAIVEGRGRFLGADIEYIEPRSVGFITDYCTAGEQAYLAVVPEDQHAILTNAVWSGKESALKAVRRGLAEDTRIVTCLPHPRMTGDPAWFPLRISWQHNTPWPDMAGWWREANGYVMTVVTTI